MWFFDFNSIWFSYWEEVLQIAKYLEIPNDKSYFLTVRDYWNIYKYINNLTSINIQQQNILFMTKRFLDLDDKIESNLKEIAYDSFYHSFLNDGTKAFENINFLKEKKIFEDLFWY